MAEGVGGGFSQSPGVSTRGQLKNKVAGYFGMPNSTRALSLAEDAVEEAIMKVNGRMWSWMLTHEDITLDTTNIEYSLQNTFKAPQHAELLDSASEVTGMLSYEDPKNFMLKFPDRSLDVWPSHYTVRNLRDVGKLTLNAVPNASFTSNYPTLRLRYFKFLTYPANDSAQVDVPGNIELLLLWWAKATLAPLFRPDMYSIAMRMFDRCWTQAVADDREIEVADYDVTERYV